VRWLREIDDAMPSVVFQVTGVGDAAVYIDDVAVAEHLDGRAVEVDPGRHRFKAKPVGAGAPQTTELVISEGAKRYPVAISFAPLPSEGGKRPEKSSGGLHPVFWIGGTVFVVGAVATGVGGGLALDNANTVKAHCPNRVCPPPYHGNVDALSTWGTVATVGAIVGAAGLATMFVGLFLPRVRTTVGFLDLRGAF
jgi:hypothetical protein